MQQLLKVIVSFVLVGLLVGCGLEKEKIAQIYAIEGEVYLRTEGNQKFVTAKKDVFLFAGDAIRTGKNSNAILKNLPHSAHIKVFPETFFEIRSGKSIGFQSDGKAVFDVEKQQNEICVETVHGITAVLGTQFGQVVTSGTFELIVEKGLVEFSTRAGEKRKIPAGKKIRYLAGQPLPEAHEVNLVESESLFGSGGFNFNRR